MLCNFTFAGGLGAGGPPETHILGLVLKMKKLKKKTESLGKQQNYWYDATAAHKVCHFPSETEFIP